MVRHARELDLHSRPPAPVRRGARGHRAAHLQLAASPLRSASSSVGGDPQLRLDPQLQRPHGDQSFLRIREHQGPSFSRQRWCGREGDLQEARHVTCRRVAHAVGGGVCTKRAWPFETSLESSGSNDDRTMPIGKRNSSRIAWQAYAAARSRGSLASPSTRLERDPCTVGRRAVASCGTPATPRGDSHATSSGSPRYSGPGASHLCSHTMHCRPRGAIRSWQDSADMMEALRAGASRRGQSGGRRSRP